jgi:hypothetical protein
VGERAKTFMFACSELVTNIIRKDQVFAIHAEKYCSDLVWVGTGEVVSLALELKENFHRGWDAAQLVLGIVDCADYIVHKEPRQRQNSLRNLVFSATSATSSSHSNYQVIISLALKGPLTQIN